MRERTTWNRDSIKQASSRRLAEDPRAMNQDHLSQQPKADKYVTGDPSTFAEDVHTPNSWDVEYSGGATKRDEIGMPEKRPETYNHPEKTASMDKATLLKKAALCARVARLMLKGKKFASEVAMEAAIEDQSVALMHMPNTELVATADRLATEEEFPGGEFPTAGQKAEEPPAQAPSQQQAQQKAEEPQAQAPQQQAQQKAEEPPAPSQQQATMTQQSIEQMVQQMVQQAMKQQAQQQVAPAQQQVPPTAEQQVAPAQQQVPPTAEQAIEPTADDMLLDEMLAPEGDMGMADMGIEMEAPTMDVGDVVLAHEDEVLKTLFANEESEQAQQQAEQAQQAEQGQKQAGVRTASTRTVGTRPTQGVSKVGGAPSGRSGGDVDKLAALWPSAPDVRDAFNMK